MLISAVQQSDSAIFITNILFHILFHYGITRYVIVSCAIQEDHVVVIHSIKNILS